jgi:fluoroacetyl-CoA thioesterase
MIQPGDTRTYIKQVTQSDFARFEDGLVHSVCSTFSLAQAAEWAGRLFVLDIKEDDEEGVGISLTINHKSPAFEGEFINILATLISIEGNTVVCSYTAHVGERLIAEGTTGQKILKKDKIASLMAPKKA